MKIWTAPAVVLAVFSVFASTACSSGRRSSEEVLEELANLDKETIFAQAEELFSKKEYQRARELFSFVYDSFPNDSLGHKAALRVADTYSVKRDVTNLTEARLRYRDFANRYPNDPDRDYALLMVGQTYSARKLRPDRDLSDLNEALSAYQQLVTLYPNSRYYDDAKSRINDLSELLADHEWQVAQFYLRNKRFLGALWRLEYIRDNYSNYSRMDAVSEKIVELEEELAAREREWKKQLEEQKKASED